MTNTAFIGIIKEPGKDTIYIRKDCIQVLAPIWENINGEYEFYIGTQFGDVTFCGDKNFIDDQHIKLENGIL